MEETKARRRQEGELMRDVREAFDLLDKGELNDEEEHVMNSAIGGAYRVLMSNISSIERLCPEKAKALGDIHAPDTEKQAIYQRELVLTTYMDAMPKLWKAENHAETHELVERLYGQL